MGNERLNKLRKIIRKNKIDALLISNSFNLRYLFGFGPQGCLALVLDKPEVLFFCPPLYQDDSTTRLKLSGVKILNDDKFFSLLRGSKLKKIGFESKDISFSRWGSLSEKLKGKNLIPQENPVETIRAIKEHREIALIKTAAGITDKVCHEIVKYIKPGLTEQEVSNRIENLLKVNGAQRASFELVIAGGQNSAFPHHAPGVRKFRQGDTIVLDLGAYYQGYCADLSRTICLGKSGGKASYRKIYNTVLEAQETAISMIKPGVKCSKIDRTAREVIAKAGLGEFFIHSTGHGVGVEIHELPAVNTKSSQILRENMVFTVEPGIYIPGWGGVRIEDMVLVTKTGCEILTKAPK